MGRTWLVILLAIALVVVALGWLNTSRSRQELARRLQEAKEEAAEKPATPALTDPAPGGCNDCHTKKGPNEDYTLQAEAARVKGHPKTNTNTVKECIVCHGDRSSKPFKKILHTAHLRGQVFPKRWDTNCIACHKMRDDGSIGVKALDM